MKLEELNTQYQSAVAALVDCERRIATLAKDDPRRPAMRIELESLAARVRAAKEAINSERTRRMFAGLACPFYDAAVAHLPPDVLAVLEQDALARQDAKFEAARAKRAATDATPPAPKPEPPKAPPVVASKPVRPAANHLFRRSNGRGNRTPEVIYSIARGHR